MENKNKNKKWYYILGAAIVVLLIASYFINKNKKVGDKVAVEKVTTRTILESVQASGRIFPETEVKISSDVSGEIIELYVKEGDSVVKGQLLARINPELVKDQIERGEAGLNGSKSQYSTSVAQINAANAQIKQAAAQVNQIKAQLANAKNGFNRNEKLHKDGVISDQDFEASEANYKQIVANLASSEAALAQAEAGLEQSRNNSSASQFNVRGNEATMKELRTNLRRTTIYAPSGGIVSKLSVKKGERVLGTIQMSGTELMRIANLNAMEIQVEVSENDIVRLQKNNKSEIEVDAYPGRKFTGTVYDIASTASNAVNPATGANILTTDQVTNFVVKVRIEPSSYRDLITALRPYPFRPGMNASVSFFTNKVENVLTVPIQSVTTREDDEQFDKYKKKNSALADVIKKEIKTIVFVTTPKDTIKIIEVKTGIQDNNFIQILSGLKAGEEVISGPYDAISRKLKSGTKVNVVTEKELYSSKDMDKKED
jgi:HlyD family secretion protein